jgi:hypothetical protein
MTTAMPNETYDWDAVRARLQEDADRGFPPSWQPEEPGDELLGRVVGVNPSAPSIYGPAPVVEIEDAVHTHWSVWLFWKTLRLAFERQQVKLGEVVLIRFHGEVRPESGGNAYKHCTVHVDRDTRTSQPDWAAIASRYGDQLQEDDEAPRPKQQPDDPGPDFGPPLADEDIPF